MVKIISSIYEEGANGVPHLIVTLLRDVKGKDWKRVVLVQGDEARHLWNTWTAESEHSLIQKLLDQ